MNKGHSSNANKNRRKIKRMKEQKGGQETEREIIKTQTANDGGSSNLKCENKQKDVIKKPETLKVTEKEVIETKDTICHDLPTENIKGELLEDGKNTVDLTLHEVENKLKNTTMTPNEENNTQLQENESKTSSKVIDVDQHDIENSPTNQIIEKFVSTRTYYNTEHEPEQERDSEKEEKKDSDVNKSTESKDDIDQDSHDNSRAHVEVEIILQQIEDKLKTTCITSNEEAVAAVYCLFQLSYQMQKEFTNSVPRISGFTQKELVAVPTEGYESNSTRSAMQAVVIDTKENSELHINYEVINRNKGTVIEDANKTDLDFQHVVDEVGTAGTQDGTVEVTKQDLERPKSKIIQSDASANEEDIKINVGPDSADQIDPAVFDNKKTNDTNMKLSGDLELQKDTAKSEDNKIIDLLVDTNVKECQDGLVCNKEQLGPDITTNEVQREQVMKGKSGLKDTTERKKILQSDVKPQQDEKDNSLQKALRDPTIIETLRNMIPSSPQNAKGIEIEPLPSNVKAKNEKILEVAQFGEEKNYHLKKAQELNDFLKIKKPHDQVKNGEEANDQLQGAITPEEITSEVKENMVNPKIPSSLEHEKEQQMEQVTKEDKDSEVPKSPENKDIINTESQSYSGAYVQVDILLQEIEDKLKKIAIISNEGAVAAVNRSLEVFSNQIRKALTNTVSEINMFEQKELVAVPTEGCVLNSTCITVQAVVIDDNENNELHINDEVIKQGHNVVHKRTVFEDANKTNLNVQDVVDEVGADGTQGGIVEETKQDLEISESKTNKNDAAGNDVDIKINTRPGSIDQIDPAAFNNKINNDINSKLSVDLELQKNTEKSEDNEIIDVMVDTNVKECRDGLVCNKEQLILDITNKEVQREQEIKGKTGLKYTTERNKILQSDVKAIVYTSEDTNESNSSKNVINSLDGNKIDKEWKEEIKTKSNQLKNEANIKVIDSEISSDINVEHPLKLDDEYDHSMKRKHTYYDLFDILQHEQVGKNENLENSFRDHIAEYLRDFCRSQIVEILQNIITSSPQNAKGIEKEPLPSVADESRNIKESNDEINLIDAQYWEEKSYQLKKAQELNDEILIKKDPHHQVKNEEKANDQLQRAIKPEEITSEIPDTPDFESTRIEPPDEEDRHEEKLSFDLTGNPKEMISHEVIKQGDHAVNNETEIEDTYKTNLGHKDVIDNVRADEKQDGIVQVEENMANPKTPFSLENEKEQQMEQVTKEDKVSEVKKSPENKDIINTESQNYSGAHVQVVVPIEGCVLNSTRSTVQAVIIDTKENNELHINDEVTKQRDHMVNKVIEDANETNLDIQYVVDEVGADRTQDGIVEETKQDLQIPEIKTIQNDGVANEEDIKINVRLDSADQIDPAAFVNKITNDTNLKLSGDLEFQKGNEKSEDNEISDLMAVVHTSEDTNESNSSKNILNSLYGNKRNKEWKEEIKTESNQLKNEANIKVINSEVSSDINVEHPLKLDDEYDHSMTRKHTYYDFFDILQHEQVGNDKNLENSFRDHIAECLRDVCRSLIIETLQNIIPSSPQNAKGIKKEPLPSVADESRNIKESNDEANNEISLIGAQYWEDKNYQLKKAKELNDEILNKKDPHHQVKNEEKANDQLQIAIKPEEITSEIPKYIYEDSTPRHTDALIIFAQSVIPELKTALKEKFHSCKKYSKAKSDSGIPTIEDLTRKSQSSKRKTVDTPDFESTRIESPDEEERHKDKLSLDLTGIPKQMVVQQQNGVEQPNEEELKEEVKANEDVEDNKSYLKTNGSLDLGTTLDSTEGGEKESSHKPLRFHSVHGDNIRLTNNNFRAQRKKKSNFFSKGLVFSSRPVAVGEKVSLHLKQLSSYWLGFITIGFTTNDPNSIAGNLPSNVIIERDCRDGFWAEHMDKKYLQESCRLHYYLNSSGNMCFGVNGIDKIEFLWNLEMTRPVWALLDIFGYFTTVEFGLPKELRNTSSIEESSLLLKRNSSGDSWNCSVADNDANKTFLNYPCRFSPSDLFTQFEGTSMIFLKDRGVCVTSGNRGGSIDGKFPLFPGQTIVVQNFTVRMAVFHIGVKYGKLPAPIQTMVKMNMKDELALTYTDSGEIRITKNLEVPKTILKVSHTIELFPYLKMFKPNQMIKIWSSNTPSLAIFKF